MDSEIQRQFRGETNPLNTAFSPPSRSDVPLTSEAKRKIKDLSIVNMVKISSVRTE